jgi:hypothetical protein
MRTLHLRYMVAMHCTQKLALEKILGLHYREFETLARCIYTGLPTHACEKFAFFAMG